jgi:Ca-activated chloride channel homolog
MLNPTRFENSRPGGFPVLEIAPDEFQRPFRLFVPLRRTELRGRVSGPLADVILRQVFAFSRDTHNGPIEALYRFSLPGDAAVTGVSVRFGEVEVLAELKAREDAEKDYEEARKDGRQAALTTRESPDVFTLSLTGIEPGQEVVVETSYVQLARPENAGWSLRIPLTTSPRFVREDETGSRHSQGQPLALMRDPGHRFALDLELEHAERITSPTHRLNTAPEGGSTRVSLADGDVLPDRDCVLVWTPVRDTERPSLKVLTHRDPGSEHLYFLAQLSPSSARSEQPPVSREVILVVDHSASMEGAKWEAADWAVKKFLWGMTDADSFNLCLFHDTTLWFSREPVSGEKGNVKKAVAFLEKARDTGGTELGVALEQALDQTRASGERARHLLVITDAEVTDSSRILRLAREEYSRAERRRISVLCIDAAPNSLLATQLAESGGGVARFLTSSPEEEDISTALDEILEDWAAPELAGVKLELDRDVLETAGRQTARSARAGWTAIDLGDLPVGRSLWVAGRVPTGSSGNLGYRLMAGNRELAFGQVEGPQELRPAMKPLFGARRVLALENLLHAHYTSGELKEALSRLGYDPDRVVQKKSWFKLYAENAGRETHEALRHLLAHESLEYGIASSEAAFIATRTEKGTKVRLSVAVPNALPAGWSETFAGSVVACAAMAMPAPSARGALSFGRSRSGRIGGSPPAPGAALYSHVGFSADSDAEVHEYGMDQDLDELAAFNPSGRTGGNLVFEGVPVFVEGEALLVESGGDPGGAVIPERATLTEIRVVLSGDPALGALGTNATLLLYVDDLASPRARIKLADLARLGWTRPLNLTRGHGEAVRLVLSDPDGELASDPRRLEVYLTW